MKELTWKYVKALKNQDTVDEFLRKYNITLPTELVKCVTVNNGGRPSVKIFDTDKGKEYVFKALLSYNADDTESIHTVYPKLFEGMKLFPIGSDTSGNFVCYDLVTGEYVLWKHETNSKEVIVLV